MAASKKETQKMTSTWVAGCFLRWIYLQMEIGKFHGVLATLTLVTEAQQEEQEQEGGGRHHEE